MGRPSTFTQGIADEICRRIAQDESLLTICKDEHLPHRDTVRRWIISGLIKGNEYSDFYANLVRARVEQPDNTFERIVELEEQALAGSLDFKIFRAVTESMWRRMASRAPKKYGDIKHLDISGGIDLNITPVSKQAPIEHKPGDDAKRVGSNK